MKYSKFDLSKFTSSGRRENLEFEASNHGSLGSNYAKIMIETMM